MLTPERVHRIIRTAGLTDRYFAREYGMSVAGIRAARTGLTWPNHPTPPDTRRRIPAGHWLSFLERIQWVLGWTDAHRLERKHFRYPAHNGTGGQS
jgi:hypothetical protein